VKALVLNTTAGGVGRVLTELESCYGVGRQWHVNTLHHLFRRGTCIFYVTESEDALGNAHFRPAHRLYLFPQSSRKKF
jgi:hypothetical protein